MYFPKCRDEKMYFSTLGTVAKLIFLNLWEMGGIFWGEWGSLSIKIPKIGTFLTDIRVATCSTKLLF